MEVIVSSGDEVNILGKKVVSAIAWNSNTGRELKLPQGFSWRVQFSIADRVVFTSDDIFATQYSLRHIAEITGTPEHAATRVNILTSFPRNVKLILETRVQ